MSLRREKGQQPYGSTDEEGTSLVGEKKLARRRSGVNLVGGKKKERVKHSHLYDILQGRRDSYWGVVFNRSLLTLICLNAIADVMITVPTVEANYGGFFPVFESVSSVLFMIEYCARFYVAGERPKYRGFLGHISYATSPEALIDFLSFFPWLVEVSLRVADRLSNRPTVDVPATAFVRVLRMFRILKTERFVGSVDAIWRVVSMNSEILGVGCMMALIFILFTSTCLYYANRNNDSATFSSIPATMYLSILMLTGQGDPDGELNQATQLICAVTAIFSVALVAIPASMLTFGFEIEATRRAKKTRERRMRRRLRYELGNENIASSSASSDEYYDSKEMRRQQRRKLARRMRSPSSFRYEEDVVRLCPRCKSCWPSSRDEDELGGIQLVLAQQKQMQGTSSKPVFISELDSSEEEYEELVLGKSAEDAYNEVKAEVLEELS